MFMIRKALMDSFGIDCSCNEISIKGLPVYMKSGRKIYKLTYEEYEFLVVELSNDDKFGTIALKKQESKYKENTGLDVIYVFDNVSKKQRDALVSNMISFICLPDQIFLPVMGIALRNHFKKYKVVDVEKMMPATQSLFLYLLFNKKESVIKSEAAKELMLTKTSITRASEQLKAMGLITEEISGKNINMKPLKNGKDFFEMAKRYLINPVQKTLYVAESKYTKDLIHAGETALSNYSMLAEPRVRCLAVYKNDVDINKFEIVDPQWTNDTAYVQLELWKYNPAIFADNNCVDIVSLSLSLANVEDERVQGELDEYMEEYNW